jgi:hypothetical protein
MNNAWFDTVHWRRPHAVYLNLSKYEYNLLQCIVTM